MDQTYLADIPAFPRRLSEMLAKRYSLRTAEALYDYAVHMPDGLRRMMEVDQAEIDRLVKIVEGYLSSERIALSHGLLKKNPRGVIVD